MSVAVVPAGVVSVAVVPAGGIVHQGLNFQSTLFES